MRIYKTEKKNFCTNMRVSSGEKAKFPNNEIEQVKNANADTTLLNCLVYMDMCMYVCMQVPLELF